MGDWSDWKEAIGGGLALGAIGVIRYFSKRTRTTPEKHTPLNGNILIREIVKDSQATLDSSVLREIAERDKAQLRADKLQEKLENHRAECDSLLETQQQEFDKMEREYQEKLWKKEAEVIVLNREISDLKQKNLDLEKIACSRKACEIRDPLPPEG